MQITGSTFVVSGAGNGIGREVVLQLLRDGAEVAALDLSEHGLAGTAEQAGDRRERLHLFVVDVSDPDRVAAVAADVLERCGTVEGVVNCAGIVQRFVPIAELETAEIRTVLGVNFWGVVNVTTAFLAHLQTRPAAALVNVSSMGALSPFPGQSAYGASKAAVKLFTEGLRAENLGTGLTVTVVFPGAIATGIIENSGVARERTPGSGADRRMTSAPDAAHQIVDAIRHGRVRVRIGKDAVLLDRLSRLMPQRSIALITARMKSVPRLRPDAPWDENRIDPDLREATRRVTRVALPHWVMRPLTRVIPVPSLDGVTVRADRADGVRVRIYTPTAEPSGASLLWVHGGGLLFGDARQDEALCGAVARDLGLSVVSVNYRVGPRHPFPAAHDDVRTVWRWLQHRASALGLDPRRVAVGGESAGGGIAAGLVHRLRDDGGIPPIAQWLFAPMLDDRTAARTELDVLAHPVWDNRSNREGWSAYLPHPPGATDQPSYAAPGRRTNLDGLPPTFVAVGDLELFHDEDRTYADLLSQAGVDTTLDVIPGAPHGFENWARDTPPARALMQRATIWLGDRTSVHS